MFPFVYEFHWTPFHVTFLLVFFTLFSLVAATLVLAFRRTVKNDSPEHIEHVRWHTDFADLPPAQKACRHELRGDVNHRTCPNGFDCRSCTVHAQIRSRIRHTPSLQNFEVYGFSMSPYRLYHRGHTWVQREDDGTFTIGIDDFGKRILGTVRSVELPPVGSRLFVNGSGMLVRRDDASVRVLSPLDGEVIGHGTEKDDWYLKVRPTDGPDATEHLLTSDEVPTWILREMERLQASFATAGVGVTLADGGELAPNFHRHFPKADWDGVLGQMFLQA
jgi:glycine cleavage system H lipoate-binding protein